MPQLSVNEVARLKGVSVRTVYRAVTDGRLPAARVGRAVLISSESASSWSPMTTKARPQQKADEQLQGTIERITGLKGVEVGRNIGVIFADAAAYRGFLERLVAEAASQQAALCVASESVSLADVRSMAAKASGLKIDTAACEALLGEPGAGNPLEAVRVVRDRVMQEVAGGAPQAWQAIEVTRAGDRLSPKNLEHWAILQQGITRIMRHLPAISFSILIGTSDPVTLGAFVSCYPQCIVLGDRSFALRSAPV